MYINDRVLDNGLTVLDTEADREYICSQEPATYLAASSTYALGNKSGSAGSIFGSPAARSPSGRKVSSAAITDGTVTTNGTASHHGAVDSSNSRLLVAGPLSASKAVVTDYPFSLASYDVGIPGPA
jgi:hypothetical protein